VLAYTLWRSRRRFRTQAQTDPLTGIANRRHFLDLAQAIARGNRQEPEVVSVFVLDIDHFKRINDTHGHQAGDAAIRHVATHAGAKLRGRDVFGRIGGEEFAALLPATAHTEAMALAESIRQSIEQTPLIHRGNQINVTVSIGLTSGTLTASNIESLMQAADDGMYRAKNAGRNRSFIHADVAARDSAVG
jgi:diguanylate cyclase (GGDEF)-like protein